MNTKPNSSDSFLDRVGLGGLVIIALLLLALVFAVSRGIPKMERDLQGRSTAALQAVGVQSTPETLHFEGRDAHLVLQAGSTVDEQVISEKLREVRGVRRVFLTREDDGEIAASGKSMEGAGNEERAPVTATTGEEGAATEGAKLGLVGDGETPRAVAKSAPVATAREELSDAPRKGEDTAIEEVRPVAQRDAEPDSGARLPGDSEAPQAAPGFAPTAVEREAVFDAPRQGASGRETAKESAPGVAPESHLNLEFDPAGIRVSGKVADQQAVRKVAEALQSAAKRELSFALSTGSAGGSMPWLAGAAEVVAGLQPDDRGRMTMSEGGGVGIQVRPGSTSQTSAMTERLKQRFMSAYPGAEGGVAGGAKADAERVAGVSGIPDESRLDGGAQAPDSDQAASVQAPARAEAPRADASPAGAGSMQAGREAGAEQARPGMPTARSDSAASGSATTSDSVGDATRNPAEELNRLLGGNALFATGSHQVSNELAPVLDGIADYFRANPGVAVGLIARPDAGVVFPFNMVVGASRAFAVRSYLILKGIQPANVLVGDPPLGVSLTGKKQIEFYLHRVMF